MRFQFSVFLATALVLTANTMLVACADYATSSNNSNRHALTGKVSQFGLSADGAGLNGSATDSVLNASAFDKPPLTGQVSQNQKRLFAGTAGTGRAQAGIDAMPQAAPSYRRPLAGSVNADYLNSSASKYGTGIADPATMPSKGNYGGFVNVSQFSGQVQRTQLAAQAPRAQAPLQAQRPYTQNPAAKRAEMEALGVGLGAAGLGALHCPVCRLLKGF